MDAPEPPPALPLLDPLALLGGAQLVPAVTTAGPGGFGGALPLMRPLASWLRPTIRGGAIWDDIWNAIQDVWGLVQGVWSTLSSLWSLFAGAFGWINSAMWNGIQTIVRVALTGLTIAVDQMQSLVWDLWSTVAGIASTVAGIAAEVLAGVGNTVLNAVTWAVSLMWSAGGQAFSAVTWVVTLARDSLAAAISGARALTDLTYSAVLGIAGEVLGGIGSFFTSVLSAVAGVAGDVIGGLVGTLSAISSSVLAVAGDVIGGLTGSLSAILTTVGGIAGNVISTLGVTLQNILTSVGAVAANIIGPVLTGVTGGLNDLKGWVTDNILRPALDELAQLTSFLTSLPGRLWNGIQAGFTWLKDTVFALLQKMLDDGVPAIVGALAGAIQRPIDAVLGWIQGPGSWPISPSADALWGRVAFFYGMSAVNTAAVVGLSLGLEGALPHKYMGSSEWVGDFLQIISPTQVSGQVITPILGALLRTPMEQWINAQARQNIPSERTLEDLWAKHEITAAEFTETMAMQGFPDAWIEVFQTSLYRDPRLSEVVRLSEVEAPAVDMPAEAVPYMDRLGIVPPDPADWWYFMKMGKAGYDNIDIPILARAASVMSKRREQTMTLMQARRLYRDGWVDDDEALTLLESAFLRGDVAEFRLSGMRLERRFELLQEQQRDLRDQFERDLIDEIEYGSSLAALGMDDQQIDLTVNRSTLKRLPRVKTNRASDPTGDVDRLGREYARLYAKQFEADLLTAEQYRAQMMQLGYSGAFAAVIVDQAALKVATRQSTTRHPFETPAGKADIARLRLEHIEGIIDSGALRAGLAALAMPPEQVDALVALAESRLVVRAEARRAEPAPPYDTPEGRLAVRTAEESFRKAQITTDALRTLLAELGMPAPLVDARVSAQEVRVFKPDTPPPEVLPPFYTTPEGRTRLQTARLSFRAELIDELTLRDELGDLEIPETFVEAYVEQELVRAAEASEPELP